MKNWLAQRKPQAVKVLLFKEGMPVAIGRAHNIDSDGMVVKTDYNNIAIGKPLDIEFLEGSESRQTRVRYRTVVIDQGAEGMGLRFDAGDNSELIEKARA